MSTETKPPKIEKPKIDKALIDKKIEDKNKLVTDKTIIKK
jgi:hypothetical protein